MEIPVRVSVKANFILMDGNGYKNCMWIQNLRTEMVGVEKKK